MDNDTANRYLWIFSILWALGSFVCLFIGKDIAAIVFMLFAIWLVM